MSGIGRRSWLAAVAFAPALSAAGCSGGNDEATETGYGTPSPTSAPDATTAPALAMLVPQGTRAPFEDLRTAASHMPMTAAALASGIAEGAVIDGDSASPAAELRSTLTALLTEHVYLSGVAVATAYATVPSSPQFQAAAAALDQNSVAVADLMAYTQSQGAFFEQITAVALPAAEVAALLDEHVATLAAAVDALAAGDPSAFDLLKTAGDHMAMSADALAGGIATATEAGGDPADDASTLRAGLTSQLVSHVYLAGVAEALGHHAETLAGAIDSFSGALVDR
jgi:hypothetical protein